VEFVGEISDAEKEAFLGNASALLFPIDWPEPFGLTMIEAMAVGTPVIAYDRGSVSEVVEDGLSGFIVSDIEEAVRAIQKIPTLDRARIRACFERRFTVERMAENYLSIYDRLLGDVSRNVQRML
jgi:glycosyltransferase involved in cell wall biosynthesis